MAGNKELEKDVDRTNSTQWAVAMAYSFGVAGATGFSFDLVNLHTGRAHELQLVTGGGGVGLPVSLSTSLSNYAYFTTPRPVNFMDFDHRGGLIAGASVGLYSWSYLLVRDGPLFTAPKLMEVYIDGGLGFSLPEVSGGAGVTTVRFGLGTPAGDVALLPPDPNPPTQEPLEVHVVYQEHDSLGFDLAGDALFDFDRADIKPSAAEALRYAGKVIRSKRGRVSVIGFTDIIPGPTADYNQKLSERRAAAVRRWMIDNKYVKDGNIESWGNGSQFATASKDDAVGRAKDRKVEIIIDKR